MPVRGDGKGTRVSPKGYLTVTRRGPHRNKYVHRMVMARMCREWCFYPLGKDGLPEGMEVHHADFQKTHNCPANLMLLDPALHSLMDLVPRMAARSRNGKGRPGAGGGAGAGAAAEGTREVEMVCRDCGRTVRLAAVSGGGGGGGGDGGEPDWVRGDWPGGGP